MQSSNSSPARHRSNAQSCQKGIMGPQVTQEDTGQHRRRRRIMVMQASEQGNRASKAVWIPRRSASPQRPHHHHHHPAYPYSNFQSPLNSSRASPQSSSHTFTERQEALLLKRKDRIKELRGQSADTREEEVHRQCTFTPRLSPVSRRMTQARRVMVGDSAAAHLQDVLGKLEYISPDKHHGGTSASVRNYTDIMDLRLRATASPGRHISTLWRRNRTRTPSRRQRVNASPSVAVERTEDHTANWSEVAVSRVLGMETSPLGRSWQSGTGDEPVASPPPHPTSAFGSMQPTMVSQSSLQTHIADEATLLALAEWWSDLVEGHYREQHEWLWYSHAGFSPFTLRLPLGFVLSALQCLLCQRWHGKPRSAPILSSEVAGCGDGRDGVTVHRITMSPGASSGRHPPKVFAGQASEAVNFGCFIQLYWWVTVLDEL